MLRAIIHSSELISGTGIRLKDGRRITENDLAVIPDGAIVYSTRRVHGKEVPHILQWVGPTAELPRKFKRDQTTDLKGRKALIPGMVDCHNHLVFGGDRAEEFALRCAGATYQEIAAKGGGIATTVQATRAASPAHLEKLAVDRIKELASYGVRTVEVKSGYGLNPESEYKILEVVPKLKKRFPELTISTTFLGAHAFPKEISREEYLRQLVDEMLPEVARRKLAESCDVFIDEGYFTVEEGRRILTRAKKLGLLVKVHADELGDTGSAEFAAGIGATSADHLLKISDDGIRALAQSNTVAVLLPGTAFYLKAPHAPARKLIDAGAAVALATDFNPGTCVCLSLPAIMTLSALYLGMSRAEIFAAVTYNAAKALRLEERKGTLEAGMDADFAILPYPKFEGLYYRFGARAL